MELVDMLACSSSIWGCELNCSNASVIFSTFSGAEPRSCDSFAGDLSPSSAPESLVYSVVGVTACPASSVAP